MKKHFLGAMALVATMGCMSSVQAQGRDSVSIVGSSTVYPFATVVAERFGRSTSFKTPKIESTGSGGGLKLFCTPICTNGGLVGHGGWKNCCCISCRCISCRCISMACARKSMACAKKWNELDPKLLSTHCSQSIPLKAFLSKHASENTFLKSLPSKHFP